MELAIVILNYRTPDLVIQCLTSLEKEVDPNRDQVVVVDNFSCDNSVEKIGQTIKLNNWDSWAKLIASPVNGGFSAGNNVGIKAVNADLYLLLNSDTIVQPGAITLLKKAALLHPEAGLIGPSLLKSNGTKQISTFNCMSPFSELIDAAETGPLTQLLKKYNVPIDLSSISFEPQWTSFACVLIRRAVIEQIGLMDEGYFLYYEDVDYCRRATAAGWKILHYPEAKVVHLSGGSGEVKSSIAQRKRPPAYYYASRSRYFAKFYGVTGLWLANICWLIGRSVSLLREFLTKKPRHTCELQAQDIWTYWRNPLKNGLNIESFPKKELVPHG